jgi:hypothetical protein
MSTQSSPETISKGGADVAPPVPVPQNQNQNQPLTQDKLVGAEVKDENSALNLLVAFVNLAQNRGAFRIDESAKIYECIKMFQKPM